MSLKLFKTNFKSNWTLLLIFYVIMLMYFSIISSMFDPKDVETLKIWQEEGIDRFVKK